MVLDVCKRESQVLIEVLVVVIEKKRVKEEEGKLLFPCRKRVDIEWIRSCRS